MEIYGRDIIIGEFKASDFNLIPGSLDFDEQAEEEMGNDITIAEQFIGRNPVPVYLDYKYSSKLKPSVTLIKMNCHDGGDYKLSEFELRHILRLITGHHKYIWMKVIAENPGADIWYKVKVMNTSLIKIRGENIGLKINMECDSQFGYSPPQFFTINEVAFQKFIINNDSDDIYTYLYPEVTITVNQAGNLELKNETEGWSTIINNLVANEVIKINSERQIITSSVNHKTALINDFNLHWIRFISGINEYSANLNCTLVFNFRTRRKGGFLCS